MIEGVSVQSCQAQAISMGCRQEEIQKNLDDMPAKIQKYRVCKCFLPAIFAHVTKHQLTVPNAQ